MRTKVIGLDPHSWRAVLVSNEASNLKHLGQWDKPAADAAETGAAYIVCTFDISDGKMPA